MKWFVLIFFSGTPKEKRDKTLEAFSKSEWLSELSEIPYVDGVLDNPLYNSQKKEEINYSLPNASKISSIKVNLPQNEDGFKNGNGEGIWVLVTKKTEKLLSKKGHIAVGRLDNQPEYPQWFHLWY